MHSILMRVVASAGVLIAAALPVSAHHSFSAEFDQNKQVTLEGKVVMMEWVNPHSWLHIDVTQPDGSVVRWKIEGGSPSVLFRKGWNRDSLPAGTKVKVVGFQAKDGSFRASSRPSARHGTRPWLRSGSCRSGQSWPCTSMSSPPTTRPSPGSSDSSSGLSPELTRNVRFTSAE